MIIQLIAFTFFVFFDTILVVIKMNDCIFCKIIKGEIPSKKIYEDDKVVVIMDVNPQTDGHVLVLPKEHVADYTLVDDELLKHINEVAKKMVPHLMEKLEAKALTFVVNYGDSQAVKHFHLHLIPDYLVKQKSEKSLDEVYEIIK